MTRPTLEQLHQRATSDVAAALGVQTLDELATALASAQAGSAHGQYGYIDHLIKQAHPATADEVWLLKWANIYQITRSPAAAASGQVQIAGTDGTVIAAETILVDGEIEYQTQASVTIANGVAIADVIALTLGTTAHRQAGETLKIAQQQAGVDTTATITTAIDGGADEESIERLRERVERAFVERTTMGSREDYAKLVREAHTDVADAWVYPRALGLGTVVLRIIGNDPTNPTPSQAVLDAVAEYIHINQPAAAADVRVLAPTAQTLSITISAPTLSQEEQTQAADDLADMVKRGMSKEQQIRTNQIRNILDQYTLDYTLVAPAADVTADEGSVWQLEVTWQA